MKNFYATKKGNSVHRNHVVKRYRGGSVEIACACEANEPIGYINAGTTTATRFDPQGCCYINVDCASEIEAIDHIIDHGIPCRRCEKCE